MTILPPLFAVHPIVSGEASQSRTWRPMLGHSVPRRYNTWNGIMWHLASHIGKHIGRIPSGKLTQLWKNTMFNGKSHYKQPCSIAMLNYQRVNMFRNFECRDSFKTCMDVYKEYMWRNLRDHDPFEENRQIDRYRSTVTQVTRPTFGYQPIISYHPSANWEMYILRQHRMLHPPNDHSPGGTSLPSMILPGSHWSRT